MCQCQDLCCCEEFIGLAGKLLSGNGLNYFLSVLVSFGLWDGTNGTISTCATPQYGTT